MFLIFVNDENFYRLLPEELGGSKPEDLRVKVMGFPPLGIETLAPVLRQHGHQVRMFDTCHPQMKESDIVQALQGRPAGRRCYLVSFHHHLSGGEEHGPVAQVREPGIPIIVGGVFATMNSDHILKDCPLH